MAIEPEVFRAALSRFASGVTVVTCRDEQGRLHGITVSAFCSVSLEPPLVLICIDRNAGSFRALRQGEPFVINILNASQRELSERFASPVEDRFDGLDVEHNEFDIPVLPGSLAVLECTVREIHAAGDHSIFVGEVQNARSTDNASLVYFRGAYHFVG